MEPNNPDNQQPLIYRIADAAGVFHLVAPVNHTHTYQDVPGLVGELNELWAGLGEKANQEDMTEALAGKQNVLSFDSTPTAGSTNPVTSGGVKAALDAKRQIRQDDSETLDHAIVAATASDGDVYILLSVREGDNTKYVHISPDNMDNLIRALLDPDTAPTANSNNLVTSGGVKAALDGKAPLSDTSVGHFIKADATDKIDLDVEFSTAHNSSTFVLQNDMPDECKIEDFFASAQGNIMSDGMIVKSDSFAVVTIYRHNDGSTTWFFIATQGLYDI